MRIRSLTLENFGPFYGQHKIDLMTDDERSVVIVHGENMRGKTSFLNAIRWCLYGQVSDRRGRHYPTHRLINYDALAEHRFYMSVVLDFDDSGHRYELQRQAQASHEPKSDDDLAFRLALRQNGYIPEVERIPEIIGNMLHEDIARFFLFDGEMLDQFEVLLSEPGREADLVKDSIDQILGLPSLQLMAVDLEELRKDAEKRQLQAMRAAKRGEGLVAQAQQVTNERDAIEDDLRRLRQQLEDVQRQQDEHRRALDHFSEIRADVREMGRLEESIQTQKDEIEDLRVECRQLLSAKWWIPMASRAADLLAQLENQVEEETAQFARAQVLGHQITTLEQALVGQSCPVCRQTVPEHARSTVKEQIEQARSELAKVCPDTEHLAEMHSRTRLLRQFVDSEVLTRFREKEVLLRRLSIALRGNQRDLKTVQERLRAHDVRLIRLTEEKYEWCIITAQKIKDNIDKQVTKRQDLESQLSRLNKEIRRLPEADPRTLAETVIYGALESIFKGAIDQFREALRQDVESEASAIFRKLTSEPAYEGLVINEQYGLTIVVANGQTIPDRSAGAEQVVALSLVGALNRCAAREGPVVMDTPFGRLDVTHRENILQFVPTLGSQVILLVQSGEFDRTHDLEHLAGRVCREYLLVRDGSATRSRFERLTPSL